MKQDRQPELMDNPDIDPDDHARALVGLSRLNRISGVSMVMYSRIRKLANARRSKSLRVLDVASGAGDLPVDWAIRAKRDGLALDITTVDISATAAEKQRALAEANGVEINALTLDCVSGRLPPGFDVVCCSLFMHHLDPPEVQKVLQSMQTATDSAMIVCDLDRSYLNLALVTAASRLVTRSPIVHFDAAASVRAAYTSGEFAELATQALQRPVRVQRLFPCRFVMTLNQGVVTEKQSDSAVAFA